MEFEDFETNQQAEIEAEFKGKPLGSPTYNEFKECFEYQRPSPYVEMLLLATKTPSRLILGNVGIGGF